MQLLTSMLRLSLILLICLAILYFLPRQNHLIGAVTTEVSECTDIGLSIIAKGGNAADAMVASTICIGLFNPQLSGLGGGGFMLVRGRSGVFETIDFRESAPIGASEGMYLGNISQSLYGGLAVGVYGEPAGLEMLHRKYGRLPWSMLLAPTIEYAKHGFRVIPEIAELLHIQDFKFLTEDPTFAAIYAPNGTALGANETAYRPALANTLEQAAKHGAKVFYEGPIADATIEAIQADGGIMTHDDLREYKALSRHVQSIDYRGYKLYSSPAPASGSIALSALNIMSGYDLTTNLNTSTHVVIEAMKYAYGQRTVIGDPDFIKEASTLEDSFLIKETAARIRSELDVKHTQPIEAYDPTGHEILNDHGTSQLITADSNGLVITLTSTINTYWGSRIMVPSTGIILNNEQNDFSSPNVSNAFGYIPTEANFIRPRKRPLSSIAPVIVEQDGKFVFVTGSAGGSRITSAVIQVLWHVLDRGLSALESLSEPRFHDQVVPATTTFEYAFDNSTVHDMRQRGHNITHIRPGLSVALAISNFNDSLIPASDPRKVSGKAGLVKANSAYRWL